ncbi:MAG: type II toxin-antitoxin system VapC family toxin, partial [Microcystaceae cyanobacterium]
MSYLLDTHILLWWLDDNPILPESARNTIASPKNVIFVSAASIWEISIKKAMGKLAVPDDLEQAIVDSNFEPLPITIPHSMQFGILAQHH